MKNFHTMRCRACELGTVQLLARAGRTERYKTIENLPIPPDLHIPTCDHCGAEWNRPEDALRVDRALQAVYRKELTRRAIAAIDRLVQVRRAGEIEHILGLSQGYLSRIRSGAKVPAPDMVLELGLLALAPESRLREAEDFWKASA